MELKSTSLKIDWEQKKMLSRYWKDKIDVFDEMIRLNVRTPSYSERSTPSEENDEGDKGKIKLGHMNVDAKLLSNKPVSLQRGKKGSSAGIEPVICIEGSDAVCYPNKEARKGRKVALNLGVLRRIEQCKVLAESIDSLHSKTDRQDGTPSPHHWRAGFPDLRPFTAPWGSRSRTRYSQERTVKSAGVCPAAVRLVGPSTDSDSNDRPQSSRLSDSRTPTGAGPTSLTVATAKRLTSFHKTAAEKSHLSTGGSSPDNNR